MFPRSALIVTATGFALAAQIAPEVTSTAKDRTGLGITIYHNNLAMIRESRSIALPAGPVQVAFADVAASIKPNSAWLEFKNSFSAPQVNERNFEFDLLSRHSALDMSLGASVAFRFPGRDNLEWGTLASVPLRKKIWASGRTPLQRIASSGPVLQEPDSTALIEGPGGVVGIGEDKIVLRDVPKGLRASPTLLVSLESNPSASHSAGLAYTADGFAWTGSYVASLSASGKSLDLDAWVALTNNSGTDFRDATLQLVAGNPNQVWEPPAIPAEARDYTTTVEVCATATSPPTFALERLSDYQLYTLDRPTTLLNHQTKQIALFRARDITVERTFLAMPPERVFSESESSYLGSCTFNPIADPNQVIIRPSYTAYFDLQDDQGKTSLPREEEERLFEAMNLEENLAMSYPPVRVQIKVQNTPTSRLGRPLPKGEVRVLYTPPTGPEVWIADSEIEETPVGESFEFAGGVASGLMAHRRATDIQLVASDMDHRTYEISFEVHIKNYRREVSEVLVREPIFAGWEILDSSVPASRVGPNAVDFKIKVPLARERVLNYRVRTNPTTFVFEPRSLD